MDEYISIFKRVHPEWIKIMKPYKLTLYKILKELEDQDITPSLEDILNAFSFNPLHTKVVIIGQDPYPKKGDACGLSFSTNATTTPKSLQNIFKCLNRLGYNTQSNDLTSWSLQGVLLLNTALTTIIGKTDAHTSIWHPFIKDIIKDLTTKVTTHSIHFLLWGNHAQSFESCITGKHIIKKWTHPSPLSGHDFTTCNHFDDLKNINWDTPSTINIYTDGASILQKKASFAVYIPDVLKLHGLVDEKKFIITTSQDTKYLPMITIDEDTYTEPTSQRGEYLAMCYALWLKHFLNLRHITIITDSANTKGLLTEWTKKTEKYKNPDLVHIMRELYGTGKDIEIEHIYSHGRENKKIQYIKGNDVVDKLARKTVENIEDFNLYVKYIKMDLGIN